MNASEFDFQLPPELIAQHPARIRDESRLLEISRVDRSWRDRPFRALPDLLRAGDVLVVNDSRVIPGRLRGFRKDTRSPVECLLLEEVCVNQWWVMARPAKRLSAEHPICLRDRTGRETEIHARLLERNQDGHCLLQFEGVADLSAVLELIGELPLPPYITRPPSGPDKGDAERYQTVYARPAGSVAAPTAGLHFTQPTLVDLNSKGVELCQVTLHVGAGTFAPVKVERLEDHVMHEERFHVPEETADKVNRARAEGRRVVAVGTTSLRTLESVVQRGRNSSFRPWADPVVPASSRNFWSDGGAAD